MFSIIAVNKISWTLSPQNYILAILRMSRKQFSIFHIDCWKSAEIALHKNLNNTAHNKNYIAYQGKKKDDGFTKWWQNEVQKWPSILQFFIPSFYMWSCLRAKKSWSWGVKSTSLDAQPIIYWLCQMNFPLNRHQGRFSLNGAMSVCLSVCVSPWCKIVLGSDTDS